MYKKEEFRVPVTANLMNKAFEKKAVQAITASASKNYLVKSRQIPLTVKKRHAKTGDYFNVTHMVHEFDLADMLSYLREAVKKNDRFRERRREWIRILVFTQKNLNKLLKIQSNPSIDPQELIIFPENLPSTIMKRD